jgi:RHS repeat-associated protein
LAAVLSFAIAGCGGCSDDRDPCAAPPIDGSAGISFAQAVRFLTEGTCPRQTGVDQQYLDATRVSVVRGRVLDEAGAPIAKAIVRAPLVPELGETRTDRDGRFSFVVLGAAKTRLRFETPGKLLAHRSSEPRVNRFAVLDDVVLVAPSAKANPVAFGSTDWQVASGEMSSDDSAQRKAIVLIPPGTRADVVAADGDKTPLETGTLRITEYSRGRTGPAAMPGELPATSAYTYASAFAFDEAGPDTRIEFSAPVVTYVDNFLHMKAGAPVPAGSLEDGDAGWKAQGSGRIVAVLAGPALDTDGDGQADSPEVLAEAGIAPDELSTLASAGLVPGNSYLRVAMTHFSAWDLNWGFGPPFDSVFPPSGDGKGGPGLPCVGSGGSWFECENRTLAEDLPLVGTNVYLHYHSDRVPGRADARTVVIPVTGAAVPASANRAEVTVTVLGVTETQTFDSLAPNLTHTFVWNGQDAYGREWPGQTVGEVSVALFYDGVYQNIRSFGAYGDGEAVTGDKTRREIALRRRYEVPLGARDQTALGLGGWSLSEHHVYDSAGRVLYRGDGTTRRADDIGATVRTIAGNGKSGGGGDGGPALGAEFEFPEAVAMNANGTMYVAESLGHRIRKIEGGIVTTFAGTGVAGHTGEGGPATQAAINTPASVIVLRDGRVCFAETYAYSVRCVGRDGIIRTILGGGTEFITAEPQRATDVISYLPVGLAEGPEGSLYVTNLDTVVRLDPSGLVELAVGGGTESGASVPARKASLLLPRGLAVGADGTLYIAERGGNRIRRVDPSGLVTTLAGTGEAGNGGDGGPAESATFRGPVAVAVDADGTVYVSDLGNARIRRIKNGRVHAYAGGGDRFSLEGSAARIHAINSWTLAIGSDGTLYADDWPNSRVIAVKSALPGTSKGETLLPDESGSEIYVFDDTGRHLRTLDALTSTPIASFEYDDAGRLVKMADRHDNVLAIARDNSGRATQITAPFGHKTALAYDAQGFLATVTDPLGRTERLEYAPGGLLTKRIDMGGGIHAMSYDETGRLVSDADAENRSFAFAQEVTPEGTKVDVITGLGRRESHVFQGGIGLNEARRLVDRDGTSLAWMVAKSGKTNATLPDGTEIEVVPEADPRLGMLAPYVASHVLRFPSGLMREVETSWSAKMDSAGAIVTLSGERRTPDGVTRMTYDGPSRTWTTITPGGRTLTATLDSEGRLARSQVPGFPATERGYDARNRLASTMTGARRLAFEYGGDGAVANIEDTLGRRLAFERDAALRATSAVHTDGATSAYAWSAMDDLTSLTPPGKPAHTLSYGNDGLLASYVAPGSSPITVGYDGDRDFAKLIYEDGTTADVVRDPAGRPSRFVYAGGEVGLSYDAVTGQVRSLTTTVGNGLAFGWDGMLLREVTASGVAPGPLAFTYDEMLRKATETVSGNAIAYDYDADGLLTRAGPTFLTRESATGRLAALSVGRAAQNFSYTTYGELASYQASSASGVLLDMALGYDALGRLVEKSENGVTTTYVYDGRGRLVQVARNGAIAHAYTYDANGNRTDVGITADERDRIVAKTGTSYTYTAKGERATKTDAGSVWRYGYDGRGHLASVDLPSGVRVDYDLDPYGRRVAKRRSGAVVHRYLYRNTLQPAAEVDAAGNVVARYVYARGELGPDVMERGGATYALVKDERGSIRFVVDASSGDVAQALEYDPFGKIVSDTNPGFQPFGFVGGLHDPDTGLVHFGARDYDPETGAFTRRDPSGFAGGDNQYAYAAGDPINYWDPNGNFIVAIAVGAAVAGAEGGITGYAEEGVNQAFDPERTGYDCAAMRGAAGRGAALAAAAAVVGAAVVVPRQTGSYTNTHQSGRTYSGKGPRERSQASGRRVARENGDPHIATDWTPAGSTRDAFKQESRRIDAHGGVGSSSNYNKVESPGKWYRFEDGEP